MLPRILFALCSIGVVQLQADPGSEKSNTTYSVVLPSSKTTEPVALSNEKSLKPTANTTINAPLVFPHQGFTTLNKTLDKLPSNVTNQTATESNNNKTIGFIKSNVTSADKLTPPSTILRSDQNNSDSTVTNELEGTTQNSHFKPTDTEVIDLQNVPTKNLSEIDLRPVLPKISYSENNIPDKSVLLIDNGDDTEDEIKAQKSVYREPHVGLVQGQMAAILAGVFLCISIVGYVAMLSWRRYLENRYGNREMLVNEFEFDEREDMKYFSI